MNDVACKVFGFFAPPLKAKGIPFDSIIEGTKVTPETLHDKKGRMDWTDFCAIMRNVRPHFTDDELVELGRSYMRAPALRFAFVIARLLLSAMDFYRWFNKPRQGVGNQMFSCVTPKHVEPAPNEIQLDLTLPDDYEVCWEFFIISVGNVEELPRLLGLPRAHVTLTRIPHGGRFHIKVPEGTPLLTRVWRFFTWPFVARSAARELKAAHEDLRERFDELELARVKLDHQATILRTANAVSDVIHGDLDLARTATTITNALVEHASFAFAELHVKEADLTVKFGDPTSEVALQRDVVTQSGSIATLVVHAQRGADAEERRELLTFVEPTIAMALQNALAYREVTNYKTNLEKLVEQRTAELQVAHDSLSATVAQLREAQEAREKFFGNISHEIRTPLSLILLAAADIERRAAQNLDERAKGGLSSINDGARKLVRLVDELLLLAAGREGKLVVSREPTDLARLAGQIFTAWRPAAEQAGLHLELRAPQRLATLVDPVALERVISNLVSNAVKYTPRGGQVEIEIAMAGDKVRVSVLDTGPGIDPELAGRLFGRFERAAGDDRRKTGTGIGLAIVKQMVEAHGGTVAALARPTGGTEFRIQLPPETVIENVIALAPAALRTTHAPDQRVSTITSGTVFVPKGVSSGTILIAEDQPQLAESVATLLSEQYKVVVALDGQAALDLVKQHEPQLLITDVEMPGMSGIELAKRFREATGDRLAPIIILSAVIDLRTRVEGLEAGAVDYVMKPFDAVELRARVQSHFKMRELAVRLHRAEQLSAMGILTSGLAHELRNPANGIVNAIEPLVSLLPEELIGPESDAGQLLEAMKASADQIAFLVRQLLGFRNNVAPELRATAVDTLVQKAVAQAKDALSGVEVRLDVSGLPRAMCAAPLLVQVLANLVENAGHAAGRGGWVQISGGAAGGSITLSVLDSGPGVPVELRERIFEPFFTTKSPGKGTGLGLAVARTIIHQHQGTLELREQDGRTAFIVSLPAESKFVSGRVKVV